MLHLTAILVCLLRLNGKCNGCLYCFSFPKLTLYSEMFPFRTDMDVERGNWILQHKGVELGVCQKEHQNHSKPINSYWSQSNDILSSFFLLIFLFWSKNLDVGWKGKKFHMEGGRRGSGALIPFSVSWIGRIERVFAWERKNPATNTNVWSRTLLMMSPAPPWWWIKFGHHAHCSTIDFNCSNKVGSGKNWYFFTMNDEVTFWKYTIWPQQFPEEISLGCTKGVGRGGGAFSR